jgi:hypothetical protein
VTTKFVCQRKSTDYYIRVENPSLLQPFLPSFMPVSAQIPQDIIDTIIDELKDDNYTLKSCSTVSHSFLRPSRRNIFSVIHLCDGPKQIKHDLLSSVSGISLFIRGLNVVVDNMMEADSDQPLYESYLWIREDETIARVLGMIPRLQSLLWRTATGLNLN